MTPLTLDVSTVKRCHAQVPDLDRPVPAIAYRKQFYSFVKSFPSLEAAERVAQRLLASGDSVILTRIARGVVLWAWEPEATLVQKQAG
ncbi:MAG: hypothetical protein VKJ46_00370 [Leptolyngbyaceae bacterium]|nr:hypothetical protein [Leptolyngbyaceae bacterium]